MGESQEIPVTAHSKKKKMYPFWELSSQTKLMFDQSSRNAVVCAVGFLKAGITGQKK